MWRRWSARQEKKRTVIESGSGGKAGNERRRALRCLDKGSGKETTEDSWWRRVGRGEGNNKDEELDLGLHSSSFSSYYTSLSCFSVLLKPGQPCFQFSREAASQSVHFLSRLSVTFPARSGSSLSTASIVALQPAACHQR